jgi:hypothetical protein
LRVECNELFVSMMFQRLSQFQRNIAESNQRERFFYELQLALFDTRESEIGDATSSLWCWPIVEVTLEFIVAPNCSVGRYVRATLPGSEGEIFISDQSPNYFGYLGRLRVPVDQPLVNGVLGDVATYAEIANPGRIIDHSANQVEKRNVSESH